MFTQHLHSMTALSSHPITSFNLYRFYLTCALFDHLLTLACVVVFLFRAGLNLQNIWRKIRAQATFHNKFSLKA